MRKKVLITSLTLFAGIAVFGQSTRVVTPIALSASERALPTTRNLTCTADTLKYGLIKELTLSATPTQNFAPLTLASEEQSQAYISPGTVSVVGVNFRAKIDAANASAIVPVRVYLYTVNASFQPLVRIDSALVTVSTTTLIDYNANFATPVSVTGNYAVAIRTTNAFDVDFYANDRDIGTFGEGLSYNKWNDVSSGGYGWYTNATAWGQDFDAFISPIVTYPIATNYTVTPSTPVCEGTVLNFSNTTTPAATLANRMYNYQAYNAYWGITPDSSFVWDMGDGAQIWSYNATHTYATAGTFNATLYTLAGFWNSCLDTKVTSIVINPNATASYTFNSSASPTIVFTNTSTNGTTYSWDFGDASPLDNTMNPSHTYAAPGTYTVVLTVTNGCNAITSTQTVTILATDIADAAMGVFNVYPNPSATGLFTINMIASSKAVIEVYNMMGQLVHSSEVNGASASIDLSAIGAGIYSMKVNANDQHSVKQIVITK